MVSTPSAGRRATSPHDIVLTNTDGGAFQSPQRDAMRLHTFVAMSGFISLFLFQSPQRDAVLLHSHTM